MPLPLTRIFDTRNGLGGRSTQVGAGATAKVLDREIWIGGQAFLGGGRQHHSLDRDRDAVNLVGPREAGEEFLELTRRRQIPIRNSQ